MVGECTASSLLGRIFLASLTTLDIITKKKNLVDAVDSTAGGVSKGSPSYLVNSKQGIVR